MTLPLVRTEHVLKLARCSMGLFAIFSSAPLLADELAESRVLEEVIVTATLREVALQDLPLSVGVLTEAQLEEIDALSLEDFWRLVPNLSVRDGALGGSSVVIRGLTDSDGFNATESINAFYVDDTALTAVTGLFATPADISLLDMNRVEVLRGPQGTLIGANSMGGAVRLISNEPDMSDPASYVGVNVSSTHEGDLNYGGRFMLNEPIGDRSAVRLAALYQDDDGFIDDIGLGRENINSKKRSAARLSWLWESSESFEVLARVYAENIETGDYNYADPIGRFWSGELTDDDYQVVLKSPQPRDEDLKIAAVRLRWWTEWGEFYSATSWYEKDVFMNLDWSPEAFFFFGADTRAPFATDIHQQDLSQEFRLSSDGSGRLNWLAGLYYLDQKSERLDTGDVELFGQRLLNISESLDRKDLALFGELSWDFTDRLVGVIGARWYRIERDLATAGFFATNPNDRVAAGDGDDFVHKVSLSWNASDDVMVYGLVSQGYRPGQFNNAAAVDVCGAQTLIDSDELVNYEVGIKSQAGERLKLNISAFYIDWDDMQINSLEQDCGFVFLQNAGKASSQGFELDLNWVVSPSFYIEGGFGYNKAELEEAINNPDINAPAGTPLPNVPEWTANLAATWDFNWGANRPGYLRVDAQYVDSRTTLFDQSFDPGVPLITELDDYTLVNARTGVDLERWRAELFVTNLFDELAQQACCRNFWDPTVNRPRTIGLRGTWRFD